MTCPVCGERKGRRSCPALAKSICSVCCGTKRLTEIQCPPDCVHLAAAREHPAAVVKRRQEQDLALILPTVSTLSRPQFELFFLLQSVIASTRPGELSGLVDDDVAEAAGALASTYETAARGVLYEHVPESTAARRLVADLKAALAALASRAGRNFDRDAAPALRAIERGARELRNVAEGGPRAYLLTMARLVREAAPAAQAIAPKAPAIIVP